MSLRAKGERNSEPALAGVISIAMGWSSTQSGGTPRTNKKYFGTRETGDRSLGFIERQRFPGSGLAPYAVAGCHPFHGFLFFFFEVAGAARANARLHLPNICRPLPWAINFRSLRSPITI